MFRKEETYMIRKNGVVMSEKTYISLQFINNDLTVMT